MECGATCIKYLLFIFNFCFVLGGLALLIPGIIAESTIKSADGFDADEIAQIEGAAIALIVIGSIIFVIAFFGCCGAIRESHCMIVTFAVLLLTLLVIQVGIAIYAFVTLNSLDNTVISDSFHKYVRDYWTVPGKRTTVDFAQDVFQCCGASSWRDYQSVGNGTIPWSCCKQPGENHEFCNGKEIWQEGCGTVIPEKLRMAGKALGGLALGVGAVELIGIIFALCLANSIRNEDRRNYRV